MGNTKSKVSADSITESLLSIMVSIATEAAGATSSENKINLSDDCKVDNTTIDQSNYVRLDVSIIQTISSEATASNELDAKVESEATATAPNLNLNPGSSEADDYTNLIANLATELSQNIGANCTLNAQNVNTFECTDNAGTSYLLVKQDQLGEYLFDCTQNIEAVSDAKASLQTFIDAHSSAETKDIITGILIVIAVIIFLIIVGYVVMKSEGGGSTTKDVQMKVVETKIKEIEVPDCSQFFNFEDCELKNNRSSTCKWSNSAMSCHRRA